MIRYAAVLAIFAATAIATAPAQAAVVTFDDAAGQAQTGGYQTGESFSDQGLTFTYSPTGSAYMYLWDAADFGAAAGSNGTNTLLVGATNTDFVTVTRTGGGVFSITSLLLGINEPNSAETTDSVLVNGVAQTITNTATAYPVSVYNVTSARISGLTAGGFVSIDNVTYQVDEPASLAIFGVGLAGLLFAYRRRGGTTLV